MFKIFDTQKKFRSKKFKKKFFKKFQKKSDIFGPKNFWVSIPKLISKPKCIELKS